MTTTMTFKAMVQATKAAEARAEGQIALAEILDISAALFMALGA